MFILESMHKGKSKSLCFSFSGGSTSAIAYLGFVDECQKHGITPDYYAGLSGGAIMAGLLGSGATPEECLERFQKLLDWKLINFRFRGLELIDHTKFKEALKEVLPIHTFEELPISTLIFATDATKNQTVVLDSGDLISAITASCSTYPMLEPTKRNGLLLIDGGYSVYYGAQLARQKGADKVVGIDVTGIAEKSFGGWIKGFYREINASISSNARYELDAHPVDLDIRLKFSPPSIFILKKKAHHLMDLGRKSAKENLHKIKKLIQ